MKLVFGRAEDNAVNRTGEETITEGTIGKRHVYGMIVIRSLFTSMTD